MDEKFPAALRPETHLLLCCSRLTLDEQTRQTINTLLRKELDWQAILNSSITQAVTPILYSQLHCKPEWWRRVPEEIRDQLEQIYHHNVERNTLLLQELDWLLAAFDAAEIPVLLMKELHLLHAIYEDPGLRPLGDLDLLVPQKDFAAAKRLLAKAGYLPVRSVNPFKEKYGFGYHFINSQKGIWIDLQTNLSQREWAADPSRSGEFRAPIQKIWRRATAGKLQENCAWRMSWEDLLFHLCVHAESHGFEELMQFCDIAAVIQRCGHDLNWAYLVETARASRMEASFYSALRLVHDVWRVSVPAAVLAQLRPAYLPAELYYATFGVLGRLHTFLDEAANDACVPAPTLRQLEEIVRTSAESNYHVYKAIDSVMRGLAADGFRPLALMTREPERVLPHTKLRPLGQIEILVAANHLVAESLKNLERQLHYALDAVGLVRLELQARGFHSSLGKDEASNTVSSSTLIKKILLPCRRPSQTRIAVRALSLEEMLLILCRRFSRHASSWLNLAALAEFLGNGIDKLNWETFWEKARQQHAIPEAAAALLCARELTRLELPGAALQPVHDLTDIPAIMLFATGGVKEQKPPKLESAILATLRCFALPTFQDRWQYLSQFVKQSHPEVGLLAKSFKLSTSLGKLFAQWWRMKWKLEPSKPAAPTAYWLEKPRLDNPALPVDHPGDEAASKEIAYLEFSA